MAIIRTRSAAAPPATPAPPAAPPAPRTALDEVLGLTARHAAGVALTLLVRHEAGREFWITTRKAHWAAARTVGWPALHALDWLDLEAAAASERACLAIAQWLAPPHAPGWIRSQRNLVQDYLGHWDEGDATLAYAHLTVRQVLEHFRCTLVGIVAEDAPAPRPKGLL